MSSGNSNAWQRFWFEPVPASSAALVRIAVGLICLGFALSLVPDFGTFYLDHGLLPRADAPPGRLPWGPLTRAPDWMIVSTWVVLMASSLLVVVGWRTRLSSVLMFLALVAIQRRDPYVLNGGDNLVRLLCLYLTLIPSGVWLSLDQRRRGQHFHTVPLIAPWGMRLIQVQLCVTYLVAVATKLASDSWRDGSALAYAWRYEAVGRLTPPAWIIDSRPIVELLTTMSMSIELAIPLLIWSRATRTWAIAAGVALHLSIHATLQVGFFSLAIFACYLAFVPPEAARRFVLGIASRRTATVRDA
jgi:hypothetical protein